VEQLTAYSDRPAYNTKAVSERTGVPADTFRAWERRYGLPKPYRTTDAHRLYSERDIASIAWLKRQTDSGLTIKQAVALLRAGVNVPVALGARPGSVEETARQLFSALAGLDSPQADRVLAGAFTRFGVEAACLKVIQPVMYRIGADWASGALPVSVEHFASYFMRGKLVGLLASYPRGRRLGPVVTACASGEQHELGILMLGLFLLRRGVQVTHLGPDLPLTELAEVARRMRPSVICLSASTQRNARALVEAIEGFDPAGPAPPRIACGGYAFREDPELRARVGNLWLGADAVQAADAIRSFLDPR
jgi:DNA-binding transcriptional MerR regulator